ncbi:MAG: DUF2490 domain-containing protein [Bacteroidales bacterium]|nr:DUF2490 domain-containing protein [Bacteroidales bacterium]
MKTKTIILGMLLFGAAGVVQAQTDEDLGNEFGARLSVQVDKKLAKGLHVYGDEEIRFRNDFKSLGRFHTTLGVTYKVIPGVKVGFGYALINRCDTATGSFKFPRHRLMLDATGTMRYGDWSFSLKERLQGTIRTGSFNEYQARRMVLELKSRVKVAYKGFGRVEPYLSGELRSTLNAPAINANYDGTYYLTDAYVRTGEAGWFIGSWTSWYVNRLRATVGVDWRIDRRNSLGAAVMADWTTDYVVDANSTGTRLKSYTKETGFKGWLTVGYKLAL